MERSIGTSRRRDNACFILKVVGHRADGLEREVHGLEQLAACIFDGVLCAGRRAVPDCEPAIARSVV